jgi:hypothetical protein
MSEKQTKWRLKIGWRERVKIVIGGHSQELMDSLRNGQGDYDTGPRGGHF